MVNYKLRQLSLFPLLVLVVERNHVISPSRVRQNHLARFPYPSQVQRSPRVPLKNPVLLHHVRRLHRVIQRLRVLPRHLPRVLHAIAAKKNPSRRSSVKFSMDNFRPQRQFVSQVQFVLILLRALQHLHQHLHRLGRVLFLLRSLQRLRRRRRVLCSRSRLRLPVRRGRMPLILHCLD
jgi:hypothetical protein